MTTPVNLRVHRPWLSALFLSVLVCLPGHAQERMFAGRPAPGPIQGLAGPATVKLGDTAELMVPAGCKFVEPATARAIVERSGNPAPKNLAGIIVPDSRAWFAIVQYADVGYVSDADKDRLNPAALLKAIRRDISRQNKQAVKAGAPAIADADWLVPPAYNAAQNTLEYAIKTQGKDAGSINCFSSLLGRRGVLSLTAVLPLEPNPNLSQLKEIMKGIAFKPGERYADHQPQDRAATVGLGEVIANHNGAGGEPRYSTAQLETVGLCAGGGLAAIVGGGFLTSLALRRRKARYYRVDGNYAHASAAGTNGNGHAAVNGGCPAPANGKLSRNGHRRRHKQFSYHAFYSDMVMNLTSSGYNGSSAAAFGSSRSNGHGETNGNGQHPESAMSDGAKLLVTETSKLIESQQKLIEGQRKLIEAQSKLIQEKNSLLDAETKMMEKQAELVTGQKID